MLSLIVSTEKPEKTKPMKPMAITDDIENEHLIDLSLGKMDFKELMELSKKESERVEKEDKKPKTKPLIQELNSVQFESKVEGKKFREFEEGGGEGKNGDNEKSGEIKEQKIDGNNFDKLNKELKNLKISSGYSFGFLNKFHDYFDNLKVGHFNNSRLI